MSIVLFIGILGAGLILLAFVLGQLHVWKDTSLIYDAVNFIGAVLLVIYGLMIEGYPFVALNGVWALVSLRDIIIDIKRRG